MRGNPGGNPENLPYPALSFEEKLQILVLSRYHESFSREDIARVLNEVFGKYNHGCRTRKGIEKFLDRYRQDPVKAMQEKGIPPNNRSFSRG
jgi:hypothetical protein